MVKYILEGSTRVYDLFISSEVEEKRQLIKLILSNLRLEEKKIVFNDQMTQTGLPFISEGNEWCAR